MKTFIIACMALLIAACSSAPANIQHSPYGDVQLKQVAPAVDSHIGETVRWGGKIIEVKNFQDHSQIQLVQFPLNRIGRPIASEQSQGRFYVTSSDFLDPEIFKVDTMLTVYGKVSDKAMLQVDQKSLTLPVVTVEESHRWPATSASGRPYNPKHDWPFVGFGYYATGSYSP